MSEKERGQELKKLRTAETGPAPEDVSAPLTQPVEAYCLVCKAPRTMRDGRAVFMANARPAATGVCAECGTKLFKIGATADHANLPRPVAKQPEGKGKTAASKKQAGKGSKKPAEKGARASSRKAGSTGRRSARPGGRLVIVESPTKARTIGRYLGSSYDVRASVGHVRDLLRSRLSVDLEHDFQPTYRVPNEKRELIKELKEAAEQASEIYLATDLDREGEAIAWHLMEAAEIPAERARRVVFHEITRSAIQDAFAQTRDVDMRLVNAQQARRILDRLVGYQISPLLWSRVRSRLSAGRVQSVALRLIVEREREIAVFVPVEYWSLDARLAQQTTRAQEPRPDFLARLVRVHGQDPDLKNRADADRIITQLERAEYTVASVKRGERRRRPAPPFTTSTLQQDASQRLGMTAQRTMRLAQDLYEGIELGSEGTTGLITYMRTDSVNIASEAQTEARALISEQFGQEYVPAEPNVYKSRAKNVQEAHEAIRPTSARRTPESVRRWLNRDQYRLYQLIWQRFIASQMAAAIYDTVSAEIEAGAAGAKERPYLFRCSGSTVRFPGFLVVYAGSAAGAVNGAPSGTEGAREQNGNGLASENGDRNARGREDANGDYSEREGPPDLAEGEALDLLQLLPEQHFTQPPPRYSEATLVKALEENGIGRPSTYASIISTIVDRGYVERADRRLVPTELGYTVNDLLVKHFDPVLNVNFTAGMEEHLDGIATGQEQWVPVLRDFYNFFEPQLHEAERSMEKVQVEPEKTGEACPECGGELVIKLGRFGKFVGCSNYPACRFTKPLIVKLGVACPQDQGELVERRTKRGRVFYGCANYPECDFSSWKKPLPHPCPQCGGLLVQASKDQAECVACHARVGIDANGDLVQPRQRSKASAR